MWACPATLSGIRSQKQIRQDERTKQLTGGMLTTSYEEIDAVHNYVRKPVDFDEFTEVVEHLGVYWLGLNVAPRSEKAA
jgi:two-component system response regulator